MLVGAAGSAGAADTIRNPTATFAGLDKITGRIISFDVTVDETVQFGTLQITPRICLTRPQTEAPLTEGFVEVDEIDAGKQAKRAFSGWMFAASPGLHGIEHPVYDVWLKDCKGGVDVVATPPGAADVNAPPPARAANAAPAPKAGRKARTITPQNPVEPTVDTLGAPPEPPSDISPLASPPPAPNDLGAPVEVGPPPAGAPTALWPIRHNPFRPNQSQSPSASRRRLFSLWTRRRRQRRSRSARQSRASRTLPEIFLEPALVWKSASPDCANFALIFQDRGVRFARMLCMTSEDMRLLAISGRAQARMVAGERSVWSRARKSPSTVKA